MTDLAADRETSRSDTSAGTENTLLAVPTEFTSRRLVSIQCLRGIAALMVVFHHVLHQSPGFLALWPTEAGQAGVDLFFVISGFVMVYVTHDRERSRSSSSPCARPASSPSTGSTRWQRQL